jgi:pSer/pThr/pTyr-binding forkhead associated (FHA) protein
MDDALICPVCQRRNRADETECTFCGETLRLPFVLIKPEKPAERTEQDHLEYLLHQYYDALILYVAGKKQSLVLEHAEQIILGRQIEPRAIPVVDLVDYGAHDLGVSRQHARIHFSDTGYAIYDMESANGTFVNEKRLTPEEPCPLHNGDLVRLGQFLLFVYFNTGNATNQVEEQHFTLIMNPLLAPSPATAGLTANRLNNHLMPYMNALIELQHFADRLRERKPAEVNILSIVYNQKEGMIAVGIRGGSDAVYILRDIIREWRRRQASNLLQQQRLNQTLGLPPIKVSEDFSADVEELSAQIQDVILSFQNQLMVSVLSYILPNQKPSAMRTHLDEMLPFLRVLSFSPLEIMFS